MKAYLVTMLIVDHDALGLNEIPSIIENTHYPNRCITPQVTKCLEFDIGPWDDDHPLNQHDTDVDAYLASLDVQLQ